MKTIPLREMEAKKINYIWDEFDLSILYNGIIPRNKSLKLKSFWSYLRIFGL